MVKRNNGFMEDLVSDLLSYSKQREPEYVATDINDLCKEIYELARLAARTEPRQLRRPVRVARARAERRP